MVNCVKCSGNDVCFRYGFTVLANLAVSLSMWQLLDHVKNTGHSSSSTSIVDDNYSNITISSNKINPGDKGLFWVCIYMYSSQAI